MHHNHDYDHNNNYNDDNNHYDNHNNHHNHNNDNNDIHDFDHERAARLHWRMLLRMDGHVVAVEQHLLVQLLATVNIWNDDGRDDERNMQLAKLFLSRYSGHGRFPDHHARKIHGPTATHRWLRDDPRLPRTLLHAAIASA